jgi:hypothetical protein
MKVSVRAETVGRCPLEATDPNPRFAATLANAFAENYISFRWDADRGKVQ